METWIHLLFGPEQKWSKGKVRDKLNNLVLFDKATYDKLYKEVPNYKLITPAVVSERLKIRGSLARAALQELMGKGDDQMLNMKCRNMLRMCQACLCICNDVRIESSQRHMDHDVGHWEQSRNVFIYFL